MYKKRWQNLKTELGTSAPIIVAGNTAMQRRADSAFVFSQNASFLWLTGINEADWRAIYFNDRLTLVAPQRSEVQVLFEGELLKDEVINSTGADEVILAEEFADFIARLAAKGESVYALEADPYEEHETFVINPAQETLRAELGSAFNEVLDCRKSLAKLRAIKSDKEIELIRVAIKATVDGFRQLKGRLGEASYEYQLEATLNAAFRETGAEGHAYDPIVAAGKNACTLHYSSNNDGVEAGDLVLVDAGAVSGGYAADITRTYAVGAITERQACVHKVVEDAHYKIINLIKPGYSLKSYIESVDVIMKEALQSLGLLADMADDKTYRKYFPHAISHGLGIDVHESLGGYEVFMPGMVLTVEPGIYIPEEGIGVRIEDDILVTSDGNENLSVALSTAL